METQQTLEIEPANPGGGVAVQPRIDCEVDPVVTPVVLKQLREPLATVVAGDYPPLQCERCLRYCDALGQAMAPQPCITRGNKFTIPDPCLCNVCHGVIEAGRSCLPPD